MRDIPNGNGDNPYRVRYNPLANHLSEILADASTGVINAEIFLPRNYPQTSRLLGIARMSHYTALLHPGRCRNDEPCHLPARARTRAVERSVRRAVCPSR